MRFAKIDVVTGNVLQVVDQPSFLADESTIALADLTYVDPTRHRIRNGVIEERPATLGEVKSRIGMELDRTDKYFVGDALNNIDAATQQQWSEYRTALRDANKLADPVAMLAAIPVDVKGVDVFAELRARPTT